MVGFSEQNMAYLRIVVVKKRKETSGVLYASNNKHRHAHSAIWGSRPLSSIIIINTYFCFSYTTF
jgi:hypothetical protein